MTCPTCGSECTADARFCWSCGNPLRSRSDERRVVTVLFADLVGFTTWSESLDPEQVKSLVDRAFERLVRDVTSFGGRVDKIVGDAIVALFGAPTAHEDDAERAVRAALRMQESLATYASELGMDIRMRIGINTGEVLVGALRAGGDYTAMGDVVNTASRLQTSADPATVLVGESTYAATSQSIEYESRGTLIARGREQPVRVWAATGARRPPGYRVRRAHAPLLGRDTELSIVEHAVRLSARHGRIQMVLLLGEAGVGKSRLADEVPPMVLAERDDAVVLSGRCVPYGEANPWWPIGDALRDGLGLSLEDDLEQARRKTSVVVERVLDDESLLPSVTNGLLHLMGHESPLRGLDPGRARAEATQALLTFLESTLRERAVLIRLADLHWADDLVLETLDELVAQLGRCPLVLVATARRSLLRRWTPRAGRHNEVVVHVDPLDRSAAAVLLESLAGRELPTDLREALLDRAGGNPLFLEELVSLLASSDDQLPTALEVPDTLRGLIAARIDGLGPDEQSTLEDAAVWGSSGPELALAKIAARMRGTEDIGPVLASLEQKEILTLDGDVWRFRSDLVREVAYARLTKLDRLHRHLGIASYLEAALAGRFLDDGFVDTVARHYTESARLSRELGPVAHVPSDLTERAIRWLGEAARRAERTAAWLLATRLYTSGIELAADPTGASARLTFLLGRSHARCEGWQFDGAREDAQAALQIADELGDLGSRSHALLCLGDVETRDGRQSEAERLLSQAIAGFDAVGDVHGRAEALRLTGMAALFHQDHDGAQAPIEEALSAFREVGDRRGEAWALQNLAWIAFAAGRIAEAETRLGEASAHFTEVGDTGGMMWTFGLLAFVRFYEGRLDEAVDLATRVRRESERRGDQWGQAMMMVILGSVELWTGRTRPAVDTMRGALDLFRTLGDIVGRVQALGALGRALVMAGEVDAGIDALAEAAVADPTAPSIDAGGIVDLATMLVRAQLGDPVPVDGHELATVAWTEPATTGQVDLAVAIALHLAQGGRAADAAELLEPVRQRAEASGSLFATSALVAAACGDHARVLEDAARTRAHPYATYHDRAMAGIALALADVAAGVGDLGGLIAIHDDLLATEDVLTAATGALALAVAAQALGSPDAGARVAAASRAWAGLGVDPVGWRRLFADAVASSHAAPGRDTSPIEA